MNISFLTTDEPLFLPNFFEHVLPALSGRHAVSVFSAPPLYKGQSSAHAARRYFASFGAAATIQLTARLLRAKLARQSIESACRRTGVAYALIADVNAPDFLDRLRRESVELLVSVSCPQIFRRALIDLPPKGILNIHGAILPHYRGVLPSFWMLANGEPQAGVSIYFVNEAIDAGELCGQEVFPISADESLEEFILRSKAIGADLLLRTIGAIERGNIEPRPLDLARGSYYPWPDAKAVQRFRAAGRRLWGAR
jgi:methionyl-tRNA formyltransferase